MTRFLVFAALFSLVFLATKASNETHPLHIHCPRLPRLIAEYLLPGDRGSLIATSKTLHHQLDQSESNKEKAQALCARIIRERDLPKMKDSESLLAWGNGLFEVHGRSRYSPLINIPFRLEFDLCLPHVLLRLNASHEQIVRYLLGIRAIHSNYLRPIAAIRRNEIDFISHYLAKIYYPFNAERAFWDPVEVIALAAYYRDWMKRREYNNWRQINRECGTLTVTSNTILFEESALDLARIGNYIRREFSGNYFIGYTLIELRRERHCRPEFIAETILDCVAVHADVAINVTLSLRYSADVRLDENMFLILETAQDLWRSDSRGTSDRLIESLVKMTSRTEFVDFCNRDEEMKMGKLEPAFMQYANRILMQRSRRKESWFPTLNGGGCNVQ